MSTISLRSTAPPTGKPHARTRGDRHRTDTVRTTPIEEVLDRALASDWSAWRELERRYGSLLLHTARGVGLSHSDAFDVAQQTWLRLWQHGRQIRDPQCLPAWLAATARREGLRVAISRKRYLLYADPTTEHGDPQRSAVVDVYPADGEYEPATEQALSRLPGRYQALIRLLMSDSCPSYLEIAEKLNLPIGSIGPMRMRALQMLRRTPELATAGR